MLQIEILTNISDGGSILYLKSSENAKSERSTWFSNFHHSENVNQLTGVRSARNFLSNGEIQERETED